MLNDILVRYVFVLFAYNILVIKSKTKASNCPPGYFGLECMKKCPTSCNGTCDLNGGCFHCSQIGHMLPYCNQSCLPGTYGWDCLKKCSENCLKEQCDAVTGHCLKCKEIGVELPNCTKKCEPGSYGLNCASRCPLSCKDLCDPVDGTCSQCVVGSGEHCTVNCAAESDQEMCRLYCPSQCLTWCNTSTSHCALCSPGYTPPFCNTTCQPGRYGNNCDKRCSGRCKDERCDPISGACFSCTDGYVGTKCNGQCIKGFYGQNCDLACPETCLDGSCDFVNGSCFHCQDGYQGSQCNELCKIGKYGQNCFLDCPKNCLKTCDPATGVCWRCLTGYREPHCNVTCEEGTFGDGCSEMCPPECVCNHITGKCNNCLSDPSLPGCETVSPNNNSTRNMLELSLYVIGSMLGLVLFLAFIMWMYQKHLHSFWSQAIRMVHLNSRETIDMNRGQGSIEDDSDKLTKENLNIYTAMKENEELERQRKLVNYLRNHGKTYTPLEYDKTELRIQYLKQNKTYQPLSSHDVPETSSQCAHVKMASPRVHVSISHATVMGSKTGHDAINRPIHPPHLRQLQAHDGVTSARASYSFPLKLKDEITSDNTRNKMKSSGEQSFNLSELAATNEMNNDKFILQSSQLFLITSANDQHVTNMTYMSDTRSKLSESIQIANRKSFMLGRNNASADSLYGITSQEFVSEGSKSAKTEHPVHQDIIPMENMHSNFVKKVRSEQSISNEHSIAEKQTSKLLSTSTWIFDQHKIRRQNSEFLLDTSKEMNDSNYLDIRPSVNGKGLTNDVNLLSLENPSPVLSEKSGPLGKCPRRFQVSASKLLAREVQSDTLESLTESTMSEAEEESSETASRDMPAFLAVDSDSTHNEDQQLPKGHSSKRFQNKSKTSSVRKNYRKVSPPKCLHSDKTTGLDVYFNQDRVNKDNHRPTYSHVDIPGNTKHALGARLSTSATVKGDSPRLVRCATTRQLSPMYSTRSATANRLTPLPTPPPEGRMHLRHLARLASSSSILEQNEPE
uniref:EGF-like domain-containing protein n=1 Tax=Biomphalaria glabrata TaxID=6526 RepID=A0A2C9L1B1_BIOGL